MTIKNRRAVGTLGLAAIVAVLAVSMIAMNFTAQPAAADHIAAKKAGGYYGMSGAAVTSTGDKVTDPDAYLATFDIKTNDKGDWMVDMAIECATANQVESKGKKANLEGAKASAVVYIEVDGQPYNGTLAWNVCSQDLQIKTQLNDLIDACTAEQAAQDPPLCVEGFPVFTCQFLNATELENTECEQSIEIYLETAGAYNVKWFLMNLDAGVHHIEIWTTLTAERTAGGFAENVTLSDSQKITSAVIINQVLVYAEPVHMMNDADLS